MVLKQTCVLYFQRDIRDDCRRDKKNIIDLEIARKQNPKVLRINL